jgi:hypothetical protein
LLIIPLDVALFFFFPEITHLMNKAAKLALAPYVPVTDMLVFSRSFLQNTIYLLELPGKYPSPLLSFLFFCSAVLIIYIVKRTKLNQPVGLWLIFLSGVNILSSMLFMLQPSAFPYSMLKFSELYITTEVGMWFFVPVIMGAALLPIPSGIGSKWLIMAVTILYSIVFGIVRYIVFLFVIAKFSYIFMPVLYFCFGPLVDFVYIVGIYSLYVSKVAESITEDSRIWKWVF